MSRKLNEASHTVRVAPASKAALVDSVRMITRVTGEPACMSDLVDELVAKHLPALTASKLAALQVPQENG